MTGLVKAARAWVAQVAGGCLVNRCGKAGCKVSLSGAPRSRLIIDLDKPGLPLNPKEKRCDYLFLADDKGFGWVAPLELKRGAAPAGEVAEQLQAGAELAEQIVSPSEQVRFRPVAASGRVDKIERELLKRKEHMVRFYGHTESVRLIKCGDPLTKALVK